MAHEIYTFLRQMEVELASEYERISKRAVEDPGTAGDEGEENWAAFLRSWLPETYHVVTKGRLISVDGERSPQIDVLVLKPSYPPALRNKKLYLAGGVAAAFECKTTLRKADIKAAIATASKVQAIANPKPPRSNRYGSPYLELHGSIVYGLLAHSHIWSPSTATRHVTEALDLGLEVNHPRDVLDVTCVADLGAWDVTRMSYMGPRWNSWHLDPLRETFPDGYASCTVFGPDPETFAKTQEESPAIPLAQLCAYLTHRLAWEDPSMRPMADYFAVVGMFGGGKGLGKPWPLDAVFSAEVVQALRAGRIDQEAWSHWHYRFG